MSHTSHKNAVQAYKASEASDGISTGTVSADDVPTLDMPSLTTDDGRSVLLHLEGGPALIVLNPGTHPQSGPTWVH